MKEEDIRKRDVFNKYLELMAKDIELFFVNASDFIQIKCPACESQNHTHEFEKTGFSYVTCNDCLTLFVNPRPPFKKLMEFYTNSQSTSYFVNEFFKPVAEVRREKIFKPRVDYLVERFKGIDARVIGDVGAGFGIFLQELKKMWPEKRLIAIEPSEEMVEICRSKKLEVIASAVEDVQSYNDSFDLLTAFELFEHLHNPELFLRKVNQLLKKGGCFFFTTLNGLGFDIQILWEKSKSVSPPHHLNFFNLKSAEILLNKCGFKVIEASTPGKLDWDIVEGMMLNEKIQTQRFWKLLAEHGMQDAKEKFQAWISENNFSSHMRILAQKI